MLGDAQFLKSGSGGVWQDPGLWTDLYHPDAVFVAWNAGHNPVVTFDLVVRETPFGGAYLTAAGINAALRFISQFHYAEDSLSLLGEAGYPDEYLSHLATTRFTGDVIAIPEGRVAFPNEPLLRVSAPFQEALLVESGILQAVNTATLIATKATRVVHAAAGRPVAEFGFRRAQSPLVAAYAARLGGCASTSFLAAASALGIPASGTIPHALVELFGREEDAFRAVAGAHERYRLLLDTYDTLRGAETAVRVGRWAREHLRHELAAVRLDSGNLLELSRQVRSILDEGGFPGTQILASGDLDEWSIAQLVQSGAPIDAFGVGTALVDGVGSVDHQVEGGSLGGVYKLAWVEAEHALPSHAALKVAGAKSTIPGIKVVARAPDFSRDVILLETEAIPEGYSLLLQPAVAAGEILEPFSMDTIEAAAARASLDLEHMPARWRELAPAEAFPVNLGPQLERMRAEAMAEAEARGQAIDSA